MPYNREISNFAPLPSGSLPTQKELDALLHRANEKRVRALVRSFSRLIRLKRAWRS